MNETVAQTRALAGLLWKSATRRVGAAPSRDRVPLALLLQLVWIAYMARSIWVPVASIAGDSADIRVLATRWVLYAVSFATFAGPLMRLHPELGKLRGPLRMTLLDELPVAFSTRIVGDWLQGLLLLGLIGEAFLALSPQHRGPSLGLLVVAWYLAARTFGQTLCAALLTFLPPHRRSVGVWLWLLSMLGAAIGLLGAKELGEAGLWQHADPMLFFARAIVDGTGLVTTAALCLAVCGASIFIAARLDRIGYDRADGVSSKARREREPLEFAELEVRLSRRGRIASWVLFGLLAGLFAGGSYLLCVLPAAKLARLPLDKLLLLSSLLVVYVAGALGIGLAAGMVRRDVEARPLLAALPITPYQTIANKARVLRGMLLPALVCFLPELVVAARLSTPAALWALSWRLCAMTIATMLLAEAAVCVAFLSNGLGAATGGAGLAPRNFAQQLLLLPLMAVAASEHPWDALLPLASLGALGFAARQAATRRVRWLDDADDEGSQVWRALLVLSAFFATQGLAAQLLGFLRIESLRPFFPALVLVVSSAVLVLFTYRARAHIGTLRFIPEQATQLVYGVLGGAVSGGLALGMVRLLHVPAAAGDSTSVLAGGALVAVAVLVVPIAEEIFFRGWLQRAIAVELGERSRRLAPLLGAGAFACAHLGALGLPQLILGLIAGLLYAGSEALLPGILAHMIHNAIVFLGS